MFIWGGLLRQVQLVKLEMQHAPSHRATVQMVETVCSRPYETVLHTVLTCRSTVKSP